MLAGVTICEVGAIRCTGCCGLETAPNVGRPSRCALPWRRVREQQDVLRPYCSLHYAWDEPAQPHRLVLELPGARQLGVFDLDKVGWGGRAGLGRGFSMGRKSRLPGASLGLVELKLKQVGEADQRCAALDREANAGMQIR